jgi:thiamine kinase-like enzyme
MVMELASQIAQLFYVDSNPESVSAISSGHINDTYLIKTQSEKQYVLQKINRSVFNDIEGLIANKVLVSEHLRNSECPYNVVTFLKTYRGDYSFKDDNLDYWMMMNFIEDSIVHDVPTNKTLVYEAGKLYGDFLIQTSNLDANKLLETIPNFHSMPFRYKQFDEALKKAKDEAINLANNEIDLVLKFRKEMHELSELKANNTFPIRITHNDAKLSNILFDKNDKGLAVIDLDTVMPGIVAYDFGDSIRSICATTQEDDNDLLSTGINLEFYESYCKGFAKHTKNLLTEKEIAYLPLGAKTITFIMGLRFLTDFLNGNIYYKTDYETHNLVRSRNQFRMVQSIKESFSKMQTITIEAFK